MEKHVDLVVSGLLEGPAYEGFVDVRKMLVTDFPYYVIYRKREEALEIIAFAHTRRRPGYWKGRL